MSETDMSDTGMTDYDQMGIDLDGDTVPDVIGIDADHDGTSDAVIADDETGTGMIMWINADGHPGWDKIGRDFDGDFEMDATMADADADGYFELLQLADGTVMTFDPATNQVIDVQKPGVETAASAQRYTTDEQPNAEPGFVVAEGTRDAATPASDDGTGDPYVEPAAATGTQDDADATTDGIYGDLDDEMWTAQYQTVNGYCAPVSVAMVVSQFIGRFVTEDEIVARTEELDLFLRDANGDQQGMETEDVVTLLGAYGVDAHLEGGAYESPEDAMNRLRDYRGDDRGVMVAVDSGEISFKGDDDVAPDYQGAPADLGAGTNHMLVVRQINDQDGTVILSDPGNPNGGAMWVISQEDFIDAWADGNYECVVTDESADDAQPAPADSEEEVVSLYETGPDVTTASTDDPLASPYGDSGTPVDLDRDELGRLIGSRVAPAGWVLLPLVLGAAVRGKIAERKAEAGR